MKENIFINVFFGFHTSFIAYISSKFLLKMELFVHTSQNVGIFEDHVDVQIVFHGFHFPKGCFIPFDFTTCWVYDNRECYISTC